MKSVRASKKNGFILLYPTGNESKLLTFTEVNENFSEIMYAPIAGKSTKNQSDDLITHDIGKQKRLSLLKTDLIGVRDSKKLLLILESHMPALDIATTAIISYTTDTTAQLVGGFFANGKTENTPIVFSRQHIVPAHFEEQFKKGIYIVLPLIADNRSFGHIILSYTQCTTNLYRDIGKAISAAMQNSKVFEDVFAAKNIAEQAERTKTEFFANMGSELCDPLKDLSAKITQMESNIEKGVLDADILGEQLLFLKSQIASQLEKTETLIELTRTQLEDLPMDKKLFRIEDVLSTAIVKKTTKEIPLLFGDKNRLEKAVQIFLEKSDYAISVFAELDGVHLVFESSQLDWQSPQFLLAEKIILLHYGEIRKADFSVTIVLPYPNLAGVALLKREGLPQKVYALSLESDKKTLLQLPVHLINKDVVFSAEKSTENVLLYWNPDAASIDVWIKLYSLRHNEILFRLPVLCYTKSLVGQTFMDALKQRVNTQKKETVLFINAKHTRYGTWATDENTVSISSMKEFDKILEEITPALIVFEDVVDEDIKQIRQNAKTVFVPILVLPKKIESETLVESLCQHPRVILCNRGVAESDLFDKRIQQILTGDEILPPHTGALVKKAIFYLNKNVSQQIVRWKLADSIHVSEDYLTRIFHKELGFSLWEYLNRYRMYIATRMLLETNDTIYEIAENAGFQDQAYFCRVFKKVYGIPPGKIRTKL